MRDMTNISRLPVNKEYHAIPHTSNPLKLAFSVLMEMGLMNVCCKTNVGLRIAPVRFLFWCWRMELFLDILHGELVLRWRSLIGFQISWWYLSSRPLLVVLPLIELWNSNMSDSMFKLLPRSGRKMSVQVEKILLISLLHKTQIILNLVLLCFRALTSSTWKQTDESKGKVA